MIKVLCLVGNIGQANLTKKAGITHTLGGCAIGRGVGKHIARRPPKKNKSGKPNIAPLQPPTLAAFRPWGSSAGAGRADLPVQRYAFHINPAK
jgi:hypothetical protein